MKHIGIRELKARASGLVREVAEQGVVYHITRHGKPAGLLAPPSYEPAPASTPAGSEAAWREVDRLAERIRSAPRVRPSALRELSRMRR